MFIWFQFSWGGQGRLSEEVLFELSPNGTTMEAGIHAKTGRMAFEAEGIENMKAFRGTELSMGVKDRKEGRRVGVTRGWNRSQILLDLEDYGKEFRFLITKGTHWNVWSRKVTSDIQCRKSILVSLWRTEYGEKRGRGFSQSFEQKILVQLFIYPQKIQWTPTAS